MAVGTGAISLSDVGTELGLVGSYSLQNCFDNACPAGFDPIYAVTGNTLRDFRGYDDTNCCQSLFLQYSSPVGSSAAACSAFPSTRYGDASTLNGLTQIWNSSACNSDGAAGWYSDGTQWRYWSGTAFTSSGVC